MRFASLGSGSRGNATLVSSGQTCILIDCGFSAREIERRMQAIEFDIRTLTAIIVTHEHADHIGGVRVLARKYQLPVYTTVGTAASLAEDVQSLVNPINAHTSFVIQDIEVCPFPVPHDAREPCQFIFTNGRHRLGLLTDAGESTPMIEEMLSHCDALLLEANHDSEMLENGDYPAHLKQRVAGRLGHLNNTQSCALLERIDTSRLQHIIAMHLSEKNNSPDIVAPLFAKVLNCEQAWIGLASQRTGFDWRELN